MPRIALVSDDERYVARIRSLSDAIEAQIVEAGSNPDIGRTTALGIMSQRPDTVMLGAGLEADRRIALTEEIDALHPQVVVVWVADEDADAWRTAMQAGARDLLASDASDEVIVDRLRRAIGIVDRRRHQSLDLLEADGAPQRGRIITVVSPKGGSGKTMLVTNIAVGLQEQTDTGVVLVDLDLQFGDVSAALGLRPEYSVVDVLNAGGDATAMKAYLTAHPTGVYTLPAPTNPAEADDAEPGQIAKLLNSLSDEFGYVVVDTGAGIDEATLTAVEQSTDVIFITTIDVAAIQAIRKAVVVLDRLELNQHNRWFVLNRASSRTGLSRAEIEDVTGFAVDIEIPSRRAVSKSMNQGTPVIIDQRRTRVGKALVAATALLLHKQPRHVPRSQS